MADFCSLCGYSDLNISELYDKNIKATILEDIKCLKDDELISMSLPGICCEHCGIVSFGINNKLEAWGFYYNEPNHKFGCVNRETAELIIFDDDHKYSEQRKKMREEEIYMKLEFSLIELYKMRNNKKELTNDDFEFVEKIYKETINKI